MNWLTGVANDQIHLDLGLSVGGRSLLYRVRNCAFLVANATTNCALATRISQLVASGQLTTLFHATIITQTIALIFSQIDRNIIQSRPPIGHFFLPFCCFGSVKLISFYYKSTTMFYSYEQCFAAMFFQRFPIADVLLAQEAPCVLSPWVFIQAMP